MLYFIDASLADQPIPDSSLNYQFIIDKLSDNWPTFQSALKKSLISSIQIGPIGDGMGFTAILKQIKIEFEDATMLSVVLKIPSNEKLLSCFPLDESKSKEDNDAYLAKMLSRYRPIHNTEVDFYLWLNHKGVLPLPSIYYAEKNGAADGENGSILMEDLSNSGFTASMYDGLSIEQVEGVVKQLAHLHKFILCLDSDDDWQQKFNIHYHNVDMNSDSWLKLMDIIVEMDREHFEEPLRRLKKTRGLEFMNFVFNKLGKSMGLPTILSHGDLWCSNIMFDRHNPSIVKAIIDPQVAFAGDSTCDMAGLLSTSTSPTTRHQLEKYIFDFYFNTLQQLMKAEGRELTFGVAQLRSAYRMWLVKSNTVTVISGAILNEAMKADPNVSDEVREKRLEQLLERGRAIVKDALQILEEDAPEWLDD